MISHIKIYILTLHEKENGNKKRIKHTRKKSTKEENKKEGDKKKKKRTNNTLKLVEQEVKTMLLQDPVLVCWSFSRNKRTQAFVFLNIY